MQHPPKTERSPLRMILVILVLGLVLTWFFSSQLTPLDTGLKPQFPNSLISPTGGQVDLHALIGKPLVVNFWGTWCPPCLQEMPGLVRVANKFAGRVGFLGLAVDSQKEDILRFQAQFQIPYTLAIAEMRMVAEWKAEQLPMTYLLNEKGEIIWAHKGAVSEDELTKEIQRVVELIGIEPTTS